MDIITLNELLIMSGSSLFHKIPAHRLTLLHASTQMDY